MYNILTVPSVPTYDRFFVLSTNMYLALPFVYQSQENILQIKNFNLFYIFHKCKENDTDLHKYNPLQLIYSDECNGKYCLE